MQEITLELGKSTTLKDGGGKIIATIELVYDKERGGIFLAVLPDGATECTRFLHFST